MNVLTDTNNEHLPNILRKKPSIRQHGSYRIFHVTKRSQDESEDECDLCKQNEHILNKENQKKNRVERRSFKFPSRNGSERWKRKSTKNKRLLSKPKPDSHSTSTDAFDSSMSEQFRKNSPLLVVSSDIVSKNHQKGNNGSETSQSDALIDVLDETINHDEAALNDLLARADKLETTVKSQDFNKILPQTQNIRHRRRGRCVIASCTVLITFSLIILVVIFVLVMTLRQKTNTDTA